MARDHGLTNLMSQKQKLTAVNSPTSQQSSDNSTGSAEPKSDARASSAIGAVSRSFEKIKAQSIVHIDPELIDPPLIEDRLDVAGSQLDVLIEQIRESGQQVPILVRPDPNDSNRYQIAYGWRRTQAAKALGIKVKGAVRALTDSELVVAQGQENNAREDLTFIEKALYAFNLEKNGFGREVIMAALAVDKTVCSRLISATSNIPRKIIDAIGSAPKVGRDRWAELATLIKAQSSMKDIDALIVSEGFLARSSDERFNQVLSCLFPKKKKLKKSTSRIWKNQEGAKIAKISNANKDLTLVIDQKQAPEFGDFIVESLPELYAAYKSRLKK